MKRPVIRKKSAVCGLQSAVSSHPHSASRVPRSRGFTLIELLMVVLVILMLSALLFRVASLVGDRALRAKAVADVQNIQNALNEYLAEYGTYPPVQTTAYAYENTSLQPPVFRRAIRNPDRPLSDMALGYSYGLASHLFKRDRGTQGLTNFPAIPYDTDTERDVAAKERWAHYLRDLDLPEGADALPRVNSDYDSTQYYSNSWLTIYDPWRREYQYRSPPPYISYRLWSFGPDGADNTGDDISNTSF